MGCQDKRSLKEPTALGGGRIKKSNMELLDLENHVKLIIAVFVVMWLFECGNLTIQHIFKNCYFFEDLGEIIFRTYCRVSDLV